MSQKLLTISVVLALLFSSGIARGAGNYFLHFDGDDYVKILHNDIFNFSTTSDFSISVVLKVADLSNFPDIIDKIYLPSWQGWSLYASNEAVTYWFQDEEENFNDLFAYTDISGDDWHTLTGRRFEGLEQLWIDYELAYTSPSSDVNVDTEADLFIGKGMEYEDEGFIGEIKEVKITKNGEIISWWDFSEGEGNTLFDKSENENNGEIFGATWGEIPLEYGIIPISENFVVSSVAFVGDLFSGIAPALAIVLGLPLALTYVLPKVLNLFQKFRGGI